MTNLQEQMKKFYSSSQIYLEQLKSHNLNVYSKYLNKILASVLSRSNILDIGSGAGQVSNFLQSKGFQVTGIDISKMFVKESRTQAIKSKLKTKFLVMDSSKLKFPNSSFDAVISAETLEHVLKPEKVLLEISRVLKTQGILVLRFPNKQSKLKNLLTRITRNPRFEIVQPKLTSQVKGEDEDLCYKASTSDVLVFLKKNKFKILYTKPFFWPSALIVARKM